MNSPRVNIVRAALEQLLAVIDSHGTESVGCDRDGETHCDCLLHAAQNAKAALSDETNHGDTP